MKAPQKYASATAFRTALEDHLKKLAQLENIDLQRIRRQAAFDRLLCRLFAKPNAPWLLKGGYAMELRLKTARTTRDIDLAVTQLPMPSADWDANAANILESLRDAGKLDLLDFFAFVFGNAMQDLDGAPCGGARFPVDARLAGRSFVKFHLDVSAGDVLHQPYESLSGRDWLGFAGIAKMNFPAVSSEEQFASKPPLSMPMPAPSSTRSWRKLNGYSDDGFDTTAGPACWCSFSSHERSTVSLSKAMDRAACRGMLRQHISCRVSTLSRCQR